jgi:acylphosphatase
MNKCLKISFATTYPSGFLQDFVQKHARDLTLEGLAQVLVAEGKTVVLVCGPKEHVDSFVDIIHNGTSHVQLKDILVEPFLKVKDYRGVFRVLE